MIKKFLLAYLIPALLIANPAMMQLSVQSSGSGWTQVINDDGAFAQKCGDVSGNEYFAGSFDAANTGTVNDILINMREVGTPGAYTFDVSIYTDSGGDPGSAITNGTISNIAYSSVTGSYDDNTFNFSTPPSITASTTYWIVIHADQIDASNYIQIRRSSSGTEETKVADSTPTWSSVDPTDAIRVTLTGN